MIGNDRRPSPYATLNQDRAVAEEVSGGLVSQLSVQNSDTAVEADWQKYAVVSGEDINESSVYNRHNNPDRKLYLICKRAIDITGSTLVLVLLLPVLVIVSIAIFLENPGPILFYQTRIGKDNRPFRFYKFRSMVKNAQALKAQLETSNEATGPIFKMRKDPRVTRVGRLLRKYSIDELPQLMNVLRGDMSLVGPRPHLPAEVATYTPLQRERLSVQPGLVCLREVTGRSELSFERWIETDLEYIECRSLRTDLGILIRLFPAVICGRGAY